MSDISSEDWIKLTMQGKLDAPTLRILQLQLNEFRGEDIREDIARVKEEIDDLFQESKKEEASKSIGER